MAKKRPTIADADGHLKLLWTRQAQGYLAAKRGAPAVCEYPTDERTAWIRGHAAAVAGMAKYHELPRKICD